MIRSSLLLGVLSLLLLAGCSSSSMFTPEDGYTHPRLIEAEFVITVDSVHMLAPDSLKATNLRRGLDPLEPPVLRIWTSDIIDRPAQHVATSEFIGEQPTEIECDHENGNRICYWDVTKKLTGGAPIVISRRFSFTAYDYTKKLDAQTMPETYDSKSRKLVQFYTKAEPFLEQTPALILLADSIVRSEHSLPGKVHRIFDFVRAKMHYKYPPEGRGVLEAFRSYEGDCGQYSALFIGLCRCAGIPARQQSGLVIDKGGFGYHVWSEVYLPNTGWVPMDATLPDGFAHLPNDRVIASVGMNLPLDHVPSWSSYADQEAQGGRTDFMQFATTVMSGFTAKVTTERKLIRDEPLQ